TPTRISASRWAAPGWSTRTGPSIQAIPTSWARPTRTTYKGGGQRTDDALRYRLRLGHPGRSRRVESISRLAFHPSPRTPGLSSPSGLSASTPLIPRFDKVRRRTRYPDARAPRAGGPRSTGARGLVSRLGHRHNLQQVPVGVLAVKAAPTYAGVDLPGGGVVGA